jgi:hypothetical protein
VTNVGTSVGIRWTAVSNAITYTVSLQNTTTGGAPITKVVSITQAAFTGLTIPHDYTVTVQANGADGSTTSATASFTAAALTPPATPPANIVVTAQSGTASTVTWAPLTKASAYQIWVGTNPSTLTATPPIFTTSTTRTLSGLTPSTTYYLKIRGLNQSGRGPISDAVSFLSMTPPQSAPTVTVTPGTLAATVSWTTVSNATAYTLYWKQGAFDKPTATAIANATSPTIVTNLTSQAHTFAVEASNAAGTGPLSSVVAATPNPLLAPTSFLADGGDGSVMASWTAAAGATSYELGYSLGAVFDGNSATIATSSTTSITVTGLTNGQTYTVAVRSVLGSNRSAWTASRSVIPNPQTSVFYRDFRDFSNIIVISSCSGTYWVGPINWWYVPCGSSQTSANSIEGNAHSGAASISTIMGRLASGSYHVWLYGRAQSARTIQLSHGSVTLNYTVTNTTNQWMSIGTLAIDPATPVSLAMSPNGGTSNIGVDFYGIYLTQGNETPTVVPTGQAGDSTEVMAAPSAPTLSTSGPGAVAATWAAVPGATGYNLYYVMGNGTVTKSSTKVENVTSPYTLTNLGSGATVSVAVTAVFPQGESVISSTQTGTAGTVVAQFYRDARDFSGKSASGGSGVFYCDQPWIGPSSCGSATALTVANSDPSNPVSSTFNTLQSGTYHVWFFGSKSAWGTGDGSLTKTIVISHNGQTISASLPLVNGPNYVGAWTHVGSITLTPSLPISVSATGLTTNTAVIFRGFYLTTENETPNTTPTGMSGDSTTAQVELVTNGGFESGCTSVTCDKVAVQTTNNWTISRGSVDWVSSGTWSGWSPIQGGWALELNGFNAGTVSQSIATTPGLTYQLTFSYSASQFSGAPNPMTAVASLGTATQNLSYTPGVSPTWQTGTISFTATSSSTLVQFDSTTNTFCGDNAYCGIVIDNVSVRRVP